MSLFCVPDPWARYWYIIKCKDGLKKRHTKEMNACEKGILHSFPSKSAFGAVWGPSNSPCVPLWAITVFLPIVLVSGISSEGDMTFKNVISWR